MKQIKIVILSISILLIALLIAGCSNDNDISNNKRNAVVEQSSIKLGASLPLRGEAASFGEGAQAGIMLAVKEIQNRKVKKIN